MDDVKLDLRPIASAPRELVIAQMNDVGVRRHLPLATGVFDDAAYEGFISGKEALWREYGYGPWAFFIDDHYAGWGGLQPEDGEAELAPVLCPWAFGNGRMIAESVIDWGFRECSLSRILIYLPESRFVERYLHRKSCIRKDCVTFEGIVFTRHCLYSDYDRQLVDQVT
ncbi:MAG: GNAT family N-acetyltransferase [Armatimonadota bacterium]